MPLEKNTIVDEMNYIAECIISAEKYGLETEVIHCALQSMKQNPKLTIQEAMQSGVDEWIK